METKAQTGNIDINGGIAAARAELSESVKRTLGELSSMLDTKRVMGEAIQIGDTTIIPVVNMGFGFGVLSGSGGGKGKEQTGTGLGGAAGGGGGVRAIGMIVIDKDGARFVSAGQKGSGIDQLAGAIQKKISNGET